MLILQGGGVQRLEHDMQTGALPSLMPAEQKALKTAQADNLPLSAVHLFGSVIRLNPCFET